MDARQNGLHTPRGSSIDAKYAVEKPAYSIFNPDPVVANPLRLTPESQKRTLGLRTSTFILSVLLVIVLALGVTSAALAGHYAMKNGG